MSDENMNLENEQVEEVADTTTENQVEMQTDSTELQADNAERCQDNQPEKKYTDADVDRIVNKRIARERAKQERLFNKEHPESALEERERKVLARELRADAKDALASEGLPVSLAAMIDCSSKKEFERSYQAVTTIFRDALHSEVTARLRGCEPPKKGTGDTANFRDEAVRNAFKTQARG